jgi:hypothetical protein
MLYSLFFSYEMQVERKGALNMEFPLTPWLEWLLKNIFPLLDSLLNYGTITMLKNGTFSPLGGVVFNIA